MEKAENGANKNMNCFFGIVITQCICVIIILIGVICVKYFFKDTYKKLDTFYKEEICSTTKIDEVISSEVSKIEI